jgi:hypothetical protein
MSGCAMILEYEVLRSVVLPWRRPMTASTYATHPAITLS